MFDLATPGPGLEDTAVQRAEIREIWRQVEGLPGPQRTALILKFQEDMKLSDIAAVMGKSEGAIKLLIHRGMTKLRALPREGSR
jgi:RNA polymerase sigma-70 factor (ECF subfamily)